MSVLSEYHQIQHPSSWTDKPPVSGRVPGQECWCVAAGDCTAHIVGIDSLGKSFGGVM